MSPSDARFCASSLLAQLKLLKDIRWILPLCGCVIASCSSGGVRPKGVFSHLPEASNGVSLEVAESVDQQAAAEVAATLPTFSVSIDEDGAYWMRAKLFFEKFLTTDSGSKTPVITKIMGRKWVLLSSPSVAGNYSYEVVKDELPGAYRYHVRCTPRNNLGQQHVAEMNARNVARFIRDGKLEISLLTR
jgi:hypothetical protein